MSKVSTYVNFQGDAESAVNHYASVFGTEVTMLTRMGEMSDPSGPALSDAEQHLVAHAELPILAGHTLMASDMVESMGQELKVGNNTTICLEADTRAETDRLYAALSDGGSE